MNIRTAFLTDARALAEIHVAAWKAAYRTIMPDNFLQQLSVDQREQDWRQWLTNADDMVTLISELDSNITGFCVYGPSREADNCGEIIALNVHPRHWRGGYGTELCRHMLHCTQKHKWNSINLWTLEANSPAQLFYATLDFKLNGRKKINSDLTGTPLTEIQMVLQL